MSARANTPASDRSARNLLVSILLWLGALWVSVVPGLVALDSGGVLPWSYWALAAVALLPATLGCAVFAADMPMRGIQPHLLTLLLLAMAGYALLQTVGLPAGVLAWVSPGTHAAWTEWLPDSVRGAAGVFDGSMFPASVAPYLTERYVAGLVVMAALVWCGATLFSSRGRIAWLLAILALTGAVHAVLGLWQVFLFPGQTIWGIDAGSPFGAFVNRNNSALLFNLSLAASLGLIGWRLAAVTGHEFGEQGFSFSTVLDLISDRASVLAMVACCLNLAALLACGSRGGLAGALLGGALALGLLRQAHAVRQIIWTLLIGVLIALVLLARVDVNPRTLERFGASAEGISESILSDARLPHWDDALSATSNYLPLGAGLGSYRYAYLPYELEGIGVWFINADNLWLEWLLEAGLVGVLAILVGVGVVIYALLQLRQTPDPMDHGIATAGWFALGAILISQSFDFGLLLAGSASAASLLFGAVLGRAATEGIPLWRPEREAGQRLVFEDERPPYGAVALAVVLLGLLTLSIPHLARYARVDAAVRASNLVDTDDEQATRNAVHELEEVLESEPLASDAWYALAEMHLARAQRIASTDLAAVPQLASRDVEEQLGAVTQIQRLLASARRLERTEPDQGAELERFARGVIAAATEPYDAAREAARAALATSPLAPEPRFLLLRLDFEYPPGPDSTQLADQIGRLRRGAPVAMHALASMAAGREDWETATEAWRIVVDRHPTRTVRYLRVAESWGHPKPTQIVPENVEAMTRAAAYQLNEPEPDLEFLEVAFERLSTEFPADRSARAQRYALLARLEAARGGGDAQFEWWVKAVNAEPRDPDIRLGLAAALFADGQYARAKRVAADAMEELGDENGRLTAFLKRVQARIDETHLPER